MAEKLETGRIVRSLSGFYDVVLPDGTLTCKARGILRKQGLSPLTGDMAVVTRQGEKGMVEQILPRKKQHKSRPAVANVDALVIFAANVNPVTEPFLIDRVTAIAGNKGVESILCVNKTDLDRAEELVRVYTHAGFRVISTSAETGAGLEELRQAIQGKLTAFTGNSGVGKSSILNRLCPSSPAHGEVSKAGPWPPYHPACGLFPLDAGDLRHGYSGLFLADTDQMDIILKENLAAIRLPDFGPFWAGASFRTAPTAENRAAPSAGPWNQARSSPPAMTATFAFTKRPPSIKNGNISECPPGRLPKPQPAGACFCLTFPSGEGGPPTGGTESQRTTAAQDASLKDAHLVFSSFTKNAEEIL